MARDGRAGGRTDEGVLRGPRGPKKNLGMGVKVEAGAEQRRRPATTRLRLSRLFLDKPALLKIIGFVSFCKTQPATTRLRPSRLYLDKPACLNINFFFGFVSDLSYSTCNNQAEAE